MIRRRSRFEESCGGAFYAWVQPAAKSRFVAFWTIDIEEQNQQQEQEYQGDAIPVGAWLVSGPHPDDLPRSGSTIRRFDYS
jgi:hypothetical protein